MQQTINENKICVDISNGPSKHKLKNMLKCTLVQTTNNTSSRYIKLKFVPYIWSCITLTLQYNELHTESLVL